jgi:hypothetical protein
MVMWCWASCIFWIRSRFWLGGSSSSWNLGQPPILSSACKVQEVGWDSSRPGYDGLIDVAKRLLLHYPSHQETEQATVRVLRSLFPSWLLTLFKKLIAPLGDGKLGAVLCGNFSLFVTLFLHFLCQDCPCKWLFLQMTEISFRKT